MVLSPSPPPWLAANAGATEVENNDLIANASTNPNNLFAGAIGHIRTKTTLDLSDYYTFGLIEDTLVHLVIDSAASLLAFDTVLTLRNGADTKMSEYYLADASETWDLPLAAGTFFLNLYTIDDRRYGGYTITTTMTPAVSPSSETEKNDTIGSADAIQSKKLYGSIGYYRNKNAGIEDWDNQDYFPCQVGANGTLSAEIWPSTTLQWANNIISIRNAANTSLACGYPGRFIPENYRQQFECRDVLHPGCQRQRVWVLSNQYYRRRHPASGDGQRLGRHSPLQAVF